jgi:hypothetical protein
MQKCTKHCKCLPLLNVPSLDADETIVMQMEKNAKNATDLTSSSMHNPDGEG